MTLHQLLAVYHALISGSSHWLGRVHGATQLMVVGGLTPPWLMDTKIRVMHCCFRCWRLCMFSETRARITPAVAQAMRNGLIAVGRPGVACSWHLRATPPSPLPKRADNGAGVALRTDEESASLHLMWPITDIDH